MPTLITTAEVAHLLQVSTSAVLLWADNGVLPVAMRTVGGHRRFDLADVEALRDRLIAGDLSNAS